jgi:DNA replication protein DnaC
MLQALEEQKSIPNISQLSFDERFSLIIDREDLERRNKSFNNRLRKGKLKENATIEDLDFSPKRSISKTSILKFMSCEWIQGHQNIIVTGSTGAGKTYMACA